jgi:alpha-galactosidase
VGTPTTLTPDEQYSYMSLWCLMASPLIFSGDMARLDPFTLNVLCNAELIDVDQDPLGKQARIVRRTAGELVLSKPLEDGSTVVGLFNLGPEPARLSVSWPELGLSGPQRVRDLWRQRNLSDARESYESQVPRHGVSVVRLDKSPR